MGGKKGGGKPRMTVKTSFCTSSKQTKEILPPHRLPSPIPTRRNTGMEPPPLPPPPPLGAETQGEGRRGDESASGNRSQVCPPPGQAQGSSGEMDFSLLGLWKMQKCLQMSFAHVATSCQAPCPGARLRCPVQSPRHVCPNRAPKAPKEMSAPTRKAISFPLDHTFDLICCSVQMTWLSLPPENSVYG